MHRRSSASIRRGAAATLCCIALACGAPGDVPDTALAVRLNAHPGLLPAAPPEGTQVVLVRIEAGPGGIRFDGDPVPVGGSLKYERGAAEDRTDPPGYWVLQTDAAGGEYRYWTPLDPGRIRFDQKDSADEPDRAGVIALSEMVVALRIPFFAGGRVDMVKGDGTRVGRFRFGARPAAALVAVDR